MTDEIKKAIELAKLNQFSEQARIASQVFSSLQPASQAAQELFERESRLARTASSLGYLESLKTQQMLTGLEDGRRAFEAALGPSLSVEKLLATNEATAFLDAAAAHETRMRAMVGPLSDLRMNGALAELAMSQETARLASAALTAYEKSFDVPSHQHISELMEQLSGTAGYLKALHVDQLAVKMHAAWLDKSNAMTSFAAFADVQYMGYRLDSVTPFDERLAAELRAQLGDWRDTITWPEALAGDITARSAFYAERGLRRELTDFPAAAFDESLEIAGLRGELPRLVDLYGEPLPRATEEEESEFARTNVAYDRLLRFEAQLREFIDTTLTAAFGADWPRHHLHKDLYDAWMEKRRKSTANGAKERPLICYADFTDYQRIISKRDLWPLFAPFFKREESVKESLQRLYLARIETMHARPISQDDELLVYVEVKRLGKAFWERLRPQPN
jgi:hypothetical protein